ncbi:hypothetical protein, partial [Staphylococcus agnetis]|uniref:hypothetical protein n=1 Tax=Staphylococcus agnetis TaxID=985762 RepID=UPI001ADA1C14
MTVDIHAHVLYGIDDGPKRGWDIILSQKKNRLGKIIFTQSILFIYYFKKIKPSRIIMNNDKQNDTEELYMYKNYNMSQLTLPIETEITFPENDVSTII